jgi:hypothetical protein
VVATQDQPFRGGQAKAEAVDPARRERVLAKAAETLERLKWQAVEHEAWLNAPDRRETAESAQDYINETLKRRGGAGW